MVNLYCEKCATEIGLTTCSRSATSTIYMNLLKLNVDQNDKTSCSLIVDTAYFEGYVISSKLP